MSACQRGHRWSSPGKLNPNNAPLILLDFVASCFWAKQPNCQINLFGVEQKGVDIVSASVKNERKKKPDVGFCNINKENPLCPSLFTHKVCCGLLWSVVVCGRRLSGSRLDDLWRSLATLTAAPLSTERPVILFVLTICGHQEHLLVPRLQGRVMIM